MKEIMLGNKAFARGLYEAGVGVCSSYPGTPSTEVTEEAAKYDEIYCEWAPNEKVALEVAFGAALAGTRSFCAMKHVGLNVAADPLFTISYTGINAGMVICVADDPGMHSSQNEQDSRHYAIASKIPMLEPSDSMEALEFAKIAYEISEEFDTPVLMKMCTRVAHSQSLVTLSDRVEREQKSYEKNIGKYVMMPGNAKRRHPIVEERTRRLIQYAEKSPLNRIEWHDKKVGVITSSTCYQYTKEALGERVSILKLGMIHPMPDQMIRDFASKVDRLVVIEELDPVIEGYCKSLGLAVEGKSLFTAVGEYSQNMLRERLGRAAQEGCRPIEGLPVRPPVMCAGCPHRGLFYTLGKNKCTVMGDIGCYSLDMVLNAIGYPKPLTVSGYKSSFFGKNNKVLSDYDANRFDVEDFAAAFVRLEGDIVLDFRISWAMNLDTPGDTIILGTEGGLRIPSTECWNGTVGGAMTLYKQVAGSQVEFKIPLCENRGDAAKGLFYAKLRSFVDAILNGGTAPVPSSQIFYNQAIIDGIVKSAELGHEIALDLPDIR